MGVAYYPEYAYITGVSFGNRIIRRFQNNLPEYQMGTAVEPTAGATATATPAEPKELLTTAPDGSEFTSDEVKTAKGTQSLGEVPLLVWNDVQKMIAFYGEDGIKDMADGTSFRVSFQGIARRMKAAGKSDAEIQDAQIRFRPGKRAGGVSTPVSRAQRAAKQAQEKLGDSDAVEKLLAKIASGEISNEDLQALTS